MKDVKDEKLNEEEVQEDVLSEEKEENEDLELDDVLTLKEKEISELKDQLLRLQADFMNFRRRTDKEKEKAMSYGLEYLACDILPSIDNFQRALDSEEEKDSGFYKGVQMIYEELIKKLNDNGIEEIKALGENFDPNIHNAVFMEESDEYEPGKVTEVLQVGYKLKDKVIRPTMVKVSK